MVESSFGFEPTENGSVTGIWPGDPDKGVEIGLGPVADKAVV